MTFSTENYNHFQETIEAQNSGSTSHHTQTLSQGLKEPKDTKAKFNKTMRRYGHENVSSTIAGDPLERFVQKVLTDESYKDFYIISYGGFLQYIYKALIYFKQHPNTKIRKGKNLIRLEVNLNNIRFLSIDDHLPKKFSSYLNEIELDEAKFFPLSLNFDKFYEIKVLPDFDYFKELNDSNSQIERKRAFYDSLEKNWSFFDAMTEYLQFKVQALRNLSLEYCEMTYEWQQKLKNDLEKDYEVINPFSVATISQFFYVIMTCYNLKDRNDIFAIFHVEKGIDTSSSSKADFKFQMFLKHRRPNHKIIGSFLTPDGPIYFGVECPDAFDATLGICYYFHGCW